VSVVEEVFPASARAGPPPLPPDLATPGKTLQRAEVGYEVKGGRSPWSLTLTIATDHL
jgi:hypothetical protein